MKILPGATPVVLDGITLRSVQSVELNATPTRTGGDIFATIVIRLDHAETSTGKIELSSFTS